MPSSDLYTIERDGSQITWWSSPPGHRGEAVTRAVDEVAKLRKQGDKGPFDLKRVGAQTHERTSVRIRGDEKPNEQSALAEELR